MPSFQRREFLRHLTATFGSFTVAACGGGNGEAEAAGSALIGQAAGSPTSPSIPGPAQYITPDPAPASTGAMRFSLVSSSSAGQAPFCIGYAFRKGDIPAGKSVVGNIANLQVTPKNVWPDGSLKFAVIAGHAALTAGISSTVDLSAGAPSTGTHLTTVDLKATGVVAAIGCGSFGTASWGAADWDNPFQNWINGPEMSSWIYRKPVGSDKHLVAWLEVRLFKGGAVEVLPWIENGYLLVAGPTHKSATYTFTLGGTQRFSQAIDLPNHCRTPLVSGSMVSHWLGADPTVTPKHDTMYLQATRLVPAYSASVAPDARVVTGLPGTYAPLQQGSYPGVMGTAGYHPSIGLLPEWDVVYLTSTSQKAWAGVIFNAYSAGRYGIHFRDEATNRPLRFSSYPNLVVGGGSAISSSGASSTNAYTPAASGAMPATWASSHHPSVGFMAYVATGRWYFMEEVQFAATLNYLKNTDHVRNGSKGVFDTSAGANTTRGAGWAVRTLAQAACITPDDDTVLRGEFLASLQANVDWNHARYVAQPNNPYGWVKPYSDYTVGAGDNVYFDAAWMQDFFTAAFGYTKSMELAISAAGSARMTEFFNWKARSIIGRLGGTAATDYLYRDAAQYTIAVAPSDNPDFTTGTGPWHSNWGAIYQDTLKAPNPGAAGDLRGGHFPEATSYWGNLQPAIAYAVEHGVTGAQQAYQRMTTAGNWPQLHHGFNTDPVWAVRPPP
jgi:hypothetical protein